MRLDAKWIFGGLAVVVAGAAGGWYLRERSTEQPNYRVIMSEEGFELRAYPALLVAQTIEPGQREAALNAGFGALADYIFAKSRGGEKIAMTAPVLSEPAPAGGWLTRFVMPGKWTRTSLPSPEECIAIDEIPARRVAVVRFSGKAEDHMLARKERALRRWMTGKGLRAAGAALHAFYNSPAIPGPLRRNEVMIPVG